jgi:hypothetical protein
VKLVSTAGFLGPREPEVGACEGRKGKGRTSHSMETQRDKDGIFKENGVNREVSEHKDHCQNQFQKRHFGN